MQTFPDSWEMRWNLIDRWEIAENVTDAASICRPSYNEVIYELLRGS